SVLLQGLLHSVIYDLNPIPLARAKPLWHRHLPCKYHAIRVGCPWVRVKAYLGFAGVKTNCTLNSVKANRGLFDIQRCLSLDGKCPDCGRGIYLSTLRAIGPI